MSKVIGTSVSRKDGKAKVMGTATYAAEHQIPGLVYGYLVTSAIAKGSIKAINTSEAEQSPGAIAVFTHQNAPKINPPTNDFMTSKIYEARLPLADNQIHYGGQIIGLVVADSFERARAAAHLVQVDYEVQPPVLDREKATYQEAPPFMGESLTFEKSSSSTGDVDTALSQAANKIEATYTTSMEVHAPMEPHAIIVDWQSPDSVTIYEPSQWVFGSQRTYAELLGLPTEKVHIVTPYIGGAFGCKAFPWPHAVLCAAAAKELQRPLKVVISRRQMIANTGHRSPTKQVIRLAASQGGKLTAIVHEVKSATSTVDTFIEPCTSVTPAMYAVPNLRLRQDLAVMNVGTPTFMRAPGENPGMWALESAMDELAWALQLDPVELRLRNESKEHQRKGLPFSSKYFADCLKLGAEKFGWQERPPQPRSLTRDGMLVGLGMAASTFPGLRGKASVKVRLLSDGTTHILTAGNDIGTGAYTVVAVTAAEVLSLPVEKIKVELGDSNLPDGGMAGGSQMTATLTPAVMAACQEVLKTAQVSTAEQAFEKLNQSQQPAFEATATTSPGEEGKQFAFQSWGAHFCEVTVDEEIGRLQVSRWLSVMNVGRVINAKAAASQIRGGVIMGISQALMETAQLDSDTGYPVTSDLSTYHVAAHADIPRIEVTFVGEPDLTFNPLGARGLGEIGIVGVAAAVANALYHATGRRVRELPITPDKLIV